MQWASLAVSSLLFIGACKGSVTCGAGTEMQDRTCVLVEDPLLCGPGTLEVEGECVAQVATHCGEGTIQVGDDCVAATVQEVSLPFEDGTTVTMGQGNHGYFSHNGYSAYAVDFPVDEGTPIAAARAGIVAHTYAQSNTGCGEASCSDQANYVVIDHGDGTLGNYWHLQQDGVAVAQGDVVQRGEVIGYSGNTGWSTGPHLHFDVSTVLRHSLPLAFDELLDVSDGIPVTGVTLTSENVVEPLETEIDYSSCEPDLFLHQGVLLDAELPCVSASRNQDYPLRGWMVDPDVDTVKVHLYSSQTQSWVRTCFPTDSDGYFDTTFRWDSGAHGTYSYLMITGARPGCESIGGWWSSPWIALE